MITLLYFARLRESLGTGREELALPAAVKNLGALRVYLAQRGEAWAVEMAAGRNLRAAVNQTVATADTAVTDGDEVAFFPPVTGG
ncbi:MAG: molybdopterin converting factor subunit 1 [Betaproteobacteria bacterium]|jgi:molybdopterin synthase sulfur carrier subunit|nr:molybdopterin converting factor subunit 1 [Betaproteobacteria bacterium]